MNPDGKTDEETAEEGLSCMESYMKELGLVMNIRELGVTEEMLPGIADGTFVMEGGYKVLTHDDIITILKKSMGFKYRLNILSTGLKIFRPVWRRFDVSSK